jgi:ATP-dependent metalloprotease FtsH
MNIMTLIEAGVGIAIGLITFLIIIGYDVFPFIIILAFGATLYFLVVQKGAITVKSKNKYQSKVKVSFQDIGGQNTAKKELIEALDFIISSSKTKLLGIRPLKGILLTGPPGTGKTLLAKATATYTDATFIATAGSEFIEMYAGVGAQRVRNLFKKARELAKRENKTKAIIFIDEVEVMGGKRGSHTSHLEYDQTLNQLLVEMDGMGSDTDVNILVVAATNRADMLDQALLRPGRFDRIVKVDLPDKEGRLQILKIHTSNKPLGDDVDLDAIALETFGFSGAHLENVTNEAAIYALRDKNEKIFAKHFSEAIEKVMMGEKLDKKPTGEELERITIHESGHAILSEIIRPDSVAHITITPRGGALGYMRQKPENDMYLYTKSYLLNQIKIAVAGSLAEEIVLGERSTGAVNDFQEAIKMARQIVFSGLSELGVVDMDKEEDSVSNEVKKIIHSQINEVRTILIDNKLLLLALTNLLKKNEKVTGKQLQELMRGFNQCA